MENIDDFNRGVGLILGRLYRNFPVPILLKMEDLEGFEDVSGDLTRKARRMVVYSATMHFLKDEEFLRFGSSTSCKEYDSFSSVVLTNKGLAVLSKTPESLHQSTGGKTSGDILVDLGSDILKKGAWEGVVSIVREMLGV